jgi:predicted nucleotidyltransferase
MENSGGFGERLRRLRKEAGVSAGTLAARVGVTENAIRKIESGTSLQPRFMTGVRMARELGVSPLVLAGELSLDVSGAPGLARVVRAIRSIRERLESEHIEHVDVFGSVARGDATPKSDVDLILTPNANERFTLLNLSWAADQLEAVLGRKVDAVTRRTVEESTQLRGALEDAVRAF